MTATEAQNELARAREEEMELRIRIQNAQTERDYLDLSQELSDLLRFETYLETQTEQN